MNRETVKRRDYWKPARLLVRCVATLVATPLFWVDMLALTPGGEYGNRHERFVDGAEATFFHVWWAS